MRTYNITYDDHDGGLYKSCHISADNPISCMLIFYKEHPGAEFKGMKLNDE